MPCREIPPCGWCPDCQKVERHELWVDSRLCNMTNKLMKRGKTESQASAIAERALRIEINQMIRWN